MEIERLAGQIVKVGDADVRVVNLPDWSLEYIEFPKSEKEEYRKALQGSGVRTVRVFSTRIYFDAG